MTTEESVDSHIPDGEILGIQFGLATHNEICKASISDCPISHASQLANPFLGLPLEIGKCESCGTAEVGKCEGHFGYIELPIPVYHPSHIGELRRLLSLLCLKCLKLKTSKPVKNSGMMEKLLTSCCEETCHVSIKESKTHDGASFLELRLPSRYRTLDDSWNFLEKYGYRYGTGASRILLPTEVFMILRKLRDETRRKLARKGYFPQDGYIMRYLPVPPNCLSVPDISDGVSVMSSDLSSSMLKKVLRQIEIIRSSRSGEPNFESHEVEANELQIAVSQYLQVRGTGKAARDADNRYGVTKDGNISSTKAWLEKMRTLFISKGSGFSSRSVITGDAFKPVNEIGLPYEIAQKMTFEERVNVHNIQYLQGLVDKNLCLTFRDGMSTYSLREGSKAHTFLKLGQIVHRRIMDGDVVFINRPPTTHKHSLQALSVYIHDGHTVKINPLMCGPLAADFDGDCVHLFYPQSLSARAEVLELFSVDKQLLSSHSGNLNLQLATDALLSLKTMFQGLFLNKASAQQLAMYASTPLPSPAVLKAGSSGPCWTAHQVLQTALPPQFECHGDKLLIRGSEVVKIDFNRDAMASVMNEILTSLFFNKNAKEALKFFDSLQPLLMENLFAEGFSVGLNDFYIPISDLKNLQSQIQDTSPLLNQLRSSFNELVQLQFESFVRHLKLPVADFVLNSSALGNLFDSRSDSAVDKVVHQIGFLGLQLSDRRKFYSKYLVEEVGSLFHQKYPFVDLYPSAEFGLVKSCFFRGLDPYEEIVHSIATREVIVRSSKGLAEPGTLFKNLMAILRDVVICYDGSVRNISNNSIIQFDYEIGGMPSQALFPAGEPVGVLAATAMSNPAYKAVLDSSPNSNSSWDMMKEILFCRINFKNDLNDRRVILYLNDCDCGRKHCQENASCRVKKHLQKVSLRDAADEFLIEYKHSKIEPGICEIDTGLVGHIHLNKTLVNESNISMLEILEKCQDSVNLLRRRKKYGYLFKGIDLCVSDCCFFKHPSSKQSNMPCLKFFWHDLTDAHLERSSHIMTDLVCPILLDTIIKGDPRIATVNIVWVSPDTISWVQRPSSSRDGELAVEVTLEKSAVRQNSDAWRIVLDCCLPVFHLIDTRRSIPYAIKQIQDLFGISCVFDQVVQRLSTSVSMVTKGVLKEHLILLASSMTCAGNLVGFNMSGIKALCRALSVQVPFTEATLYTPRKCFERASEKCHVDSLASIVASCSWGKHVAIGTGAKFDILWDTKEAAMGDNPIDVYNFLQLVRGSNEEDDDAGCLGEDIEKFDWEDAFMEPASPDQENKATFEETIEVGLDSGAGDSSWDVNGGSGWNVNNSGSGSGEAEGSGWSSWGAKKGQTQTEAEPSSAWGKPVKENDSGGWQNNGSQWDSKASEKSQMEESKKQPWGSASSDGAEKWGQPSSTPRKNNSDENFGGTSNKINEQGGSGKWDSDKGEGMKQPSWGGSGGSSWSNGNENAGSQAWKSGKEENKSWSSQGPSQGNWGSAKSNNPAQPSGAPWSSKSNQQADSGGWGSEKKESKGQSSWGVQDNSSQKSSHEVGSQSWNVQKEENNAKSWGSKKEEIKTQSSWGKPSDATWKSSTPSGNDWNSEKPSEQGGSSSWGSKVGQIKAHSSWGQNNPTESAGGWGAGKDSEDAGSKIWNSKRQESNAQPSWGKASDASGKNFSQSSGAWGSEKPAGGAGSKPWESKGLNKSNAQPSWGKASDASGKNFSQSSGAWGSEKPAGGAGGKPWESKGPNKSTGDWNSQSTNEVLGSKDWGSKKQESETPSSWGKPTDTTSWKTQSTNEVSGSKDWGSNKQESKTSSSWGKPSDTPTGKSSEESAGGWNSEKPNNEPVSKGWGSAKNETKPQSSSWGKPSESTQEETFSADEWGSKKSASPSSSQAWGSVKASSENENEKQGGWGKPSGSAWKKGSQENTNGSDGNDESQTPGGSQGWGSPKVGAGNEGESQSPWGQPGSTGWKKKRPEGSHGWGSSNSGEWKSKRNRLPPPKQGGPTDDANPVAFTATRKRVDIFTPEEQGALTEIEGIIQSIRRIMHQPGFNDGDPLPAEDQTYIIDNVLNHHPDKEAKMGSGIDYITVRKHSNFQDSRCFYVVSTDGKMEDFSYIKCLGNLMKAKHPSVAESFTSKYFGRPRGGGNRPQEGGGGNRSQEGGGGWGNRSQDSSGGWGPRSQEGGGKSPREGGSGGWGNRSKEDGGKSPQEGGGGGGWGNHSEEGGEKNSAQGGGGVGGWGSNPQQGSVGSKPQQGGWENKPQESGGGSNPQQGGWGSNPQEGSGGSKPQEGGGWGSNPQEGSGGSKPQEGGGWGNKSQEGSDGSKPQEGGGWGSKPQEGSGGSKPQEGGGWGSKPQEGSGGSKPQEGGWGKKPQEAGSGSNPQEGGWGSDSQGW